MARVSEQETWAQQGRSEMDKSTELLCVLQEPARRRTWLLCKALECAPMDRALDLARIADQFIMGSALST